MTTNLEKAFKDYFSNHMAIMGQKMAVDYQSDCCGCSILTENMDIDMCRFVCSECREECNGIEKCHMCSGDGLRYEYSSSGGFERVECYKCKGTGEEAV